VSDPSNDEIDRLAPLESRHFLRRLRREIAGADAADVPFPCDQDLHPEGRRR
jgi:hypothetical protein